MMNKQNYIVYYTGGDENPYPWFPEEYEDTNILDVINSLTDIYEYDIDKYKIVIKDSDEHKALELESLVKHGKSLMNLTYSDRMKY